MCPSTGVRGPGELLVKHKTLATIKALISPPSTRQQPQEQGGKGSVGGQVSSNAWRTKLQENERAMLEIAAVSRYGSQ
eukprot:COSAG05_NODE_45_length_25418_cov_92.923299_23_plen_78_part_00